MPQQQADVSRDGDDDALRVQVSEGKVDFDLLEVFAKRVDQELPMAAGRRRKLSVLYPCAWHQPCQDRVQQGPHAALGHATDGARGPA